MKPNHSAGQRVSGVLETLMRMGNAGQRVKGGKLRAAIQKVICMLSIEVHHFFHPQGESEVLTKLDKLVTSNFHLKESIMALTAQQQGVSDALTATLAAQAKTAAEIVTLQDSVTGLQATITELKDAVAAAGNVPQEIVDLVDQVQASAVAIDNQIPDVPPPVVLPPTP